MTDTVNPVPEGSEGVIPYLVIRGASAAIEFYKTVFGAEEVQRLAGPDGMIGHAELRISGRPLMMADEVPDMNIKAPPTIGGSATGLMLYCSDADAVFQAAIDAGAVEFKPICEQFYGERCGTFDDPFGHRWTVSSRTRDYTRAEVKERFDDLYGDD